MVKKISFLFLALILYTGNASAAFIKNVREGCFEFRIDIKDSGRFVNYSKLSLVFQDFARLNDAIVFNDITIERIGQVFILTKTDGNFPSAAAFLTSGLPDWIIALLRTPTRIKSIEGTEPDVLFGDPSGNSGMDFSGRHIESIKLIVTDLVFIFGFDHNGPYTQIAVQAVVTIDYGGAPPLPLVADFSATPTSGTAPLTISFIDKSIGNITSWKWDFGDASTSTAKNPSHTYSTPGKYTVSLTVGGPDGSDTKHSNEFISVYSKVNPGIQMLLLSE